jgi:4-aminobutyrate aminotransferase/(S)-3-amino-2-methylpropionate transaminase
MIISKGLSGSFPIAGVVGREELMSAMPQGLQSTSFEGNPVACAAAVASMDYLKSIDAPRLARAIGDRFGAWAANHHHDVIGESRGRGALWGLELVHPGTTEPWQELARGIQRDALAQGLVLYRSGRYGNVIGLVPPLVADGQELDAGLEKLEKILVNVESTSNASR